MKVEGKDKAFDISNDTTWKLLEGRDPQSLGLSSSQIEERTKDYTNMWEDRSTVINVTRRKPTGTLVPDDGEYHDDVAVKDPNLALGGT